MCKQCLEAAAKIAGAEWETYRETKKAHERLSPHPFDAGQFGIDFAAANRSHDLAEQIRALPCQCEAARAVKDAERDAHADIEVRLRLRLRDGYWFCTSDDLPGLNILHPNLSLVLDDVELAWKKINEIAPNQWPQLPAAIAQEGK